MLTRRLRRLRENALLRELVSEVNLDRDKLIMPYFIMEGDNVREQIKSMPGIDRVSIDNLLSDMEEDLRRGINKFIFFGIPSEKDEIASQAYDDEGIIQKALRSVKKHFPESFIISDVCLCEYMNHGHCGIIKDGKVLNDPSIDLLLKTALSHAEAGVDMVAPSDMMDGRVGAIRKSLDEKGFEGLPIMSYSAKYASSFYGPFREAAGSAPAFGDRKSYQMDYRNRREAINEILLDIEEGADIIMIKPALSYLDIVKSARDLIKQPISLYNVSGEYSMVKASASLEYAKEDELVREIMTSFFRAGADMVISYHTRDIYKNNWF